MIEIICKFVNSAMRATFSAYLFLLYLITLIIPKTMVKIIVILDFRYLAFIKPLDYGEHSRVISIRESVSPQNTINISH
jgi:hypothetical protein